MNSLEKYQWVTEAMGNQLNARFTFQSKWGNPKTGTYDVISNNQQDEPFDMFKLKKLAMIENNMPAIRKFLLTKVDAWDDPKGPKDYKKSYIVAIRILGKGFGAVIRFSTILQHFPYVEVDDNGEPLYGGLEG